ncbi:MAG: peptidase [Hydrogenophaga sp.]|jgi:transposase-like protein|nr:peptidase [Hydrogenophaga sp.]
MRRIHIFKAGRQTAMSGATIDFTEADLAATAAAYDPAKHEAPIVVGHPATDDPAYGWVRGLTAQGADLFAEPHEVNPAFAEQVQAKAYKKVSASFYSPQHPSNPTPGVYALRHVGFLGAQPPAVKGLKPIDYADAADCIEIELDFSEESAAGQTEWKFPAAAAATTPQPTTTTETPEPSSLPPESEAAKSGTGVSPEGSATPPPETTTVTPEEKAALEAQNAQLQADLAVAQTALQAQATAANTAAHTAFAEALIAEARVAPADKALLIATLDHLEPPVLAGAQAPQVVEFGEGDTKKPMAEALKDWLKALPKRVEFGEQAGRARAAADDKDKTGDTVQYAEGTPPEAIELDKRIRKYATDNKLSYADAASAVSVLR